jgi:tetratricopeptide (TPR) repeat protein
MTGTDCTHAETRWVTRRVKERPVDVRICNRCGKALTLSRLTLPTRPLVPNRCANCGASRREQMLVAAVAPGEKVDLSPVCTACELSRRDDRRLHLALARKLGCEELAEAAHKATELGRNTLALKLATASFPFEEDPLLARSVRLQALEAIGEGAIAEKEGINWLRDESTPGFVGGIVGDILLRHGKPEEALEAMTIGLARDPADRYLRVERAEVLAELEHFEDAAQEAVSCIAEQDPITERALELLLRVTDHYFGVGAWQDVREVFAATAPWSHSAPDMCYMQACAEMDRQNLSEARRWFLRAIQLEPEHDEAAQALAELEHRMGLAKTPMSRR